MRIGILGTGGVGRTLAGALSEQGHEVVMGSRDPAVALASTDANQQTDTTWSGWQASNSAVRIATFAEAAAHGEVLMLATAGDGSLAAAAAAGDEHLDGTVLIDISNPLSWSVQGTSLTMMNTDSLAEQVQRQHPGARVVKALNTVTASLMVDPTTLAGGDHTLPICGNDDAKQ